MKLLYDLFPIILFFLSYHQAEVILEHTPVELLIDTSQPDVIVATMVATLVAIIASIVQVSTHWIRTRSFERMHLFSAGLITVLGGITIMLKDPAFIQWKPTVLNWLFAIVFLVSQYVGKSSLVKRMMSSQVSLPEPVWIRLNLSWVVFFILSGAANLYVAFYYGLDLDEETRMDNWVNFKLFGLLGLTFIFVFAQALYLSRYISEDDIKQNGESPSGDSPSGDGK